MVLKSLPSGIELKFFDLAAAILKDNSLEMYDLEWNSVSGELRVFIIDPKTQTATLDDCVKVDRAFNPYVETESWIPENLTLEVSSPGLFRQLNQVKHFKDVVGKDISLVLLKKIDEVNYPDFPKSLRNNLKLKVILEDVSDSSIFVSAKGIKIEIPFSQIKKANLDTDIINHQLDNN